MGSDKAVDTVAAVFVTSAVCQAALGWMGICETADGEGAEEEEKGEFLHGMLLCEDEGLDEWYRLISLLYMMLSGCYLGSEERQSSVASN